MTQPPKRPSDAPGATVRLDAPTMPRVIDPWIGTLFGNYRAVRKLGEGGMGVVYEAEHQKIGHRAAVKILKRELALDEEYAQRFLNEARAVNIIRHPGLVEIFAPAFIVRAGTQAVERFGRECDRRHADSEVAEQAAAAAYEAFVGRDHQRAHAIEVAAHANVADRLQQRHVEPEQRATARLRAHTDLAAHEVDQALADGQSETGATVQARGRGIGLRERCEQPGGGFLVETDAGVAHAEHGFSYFRE